MRLCLETSTPLKKIIISMKYYVKEIEAKNREERFQVQPLGSETSR